MHFSFLTLFPQLIEGYFSDSILKNARENGLISIEAIQIRDFATNAYKSVDMPQIGGGAGQVISYEVLSRAISSLQKTTNQDARQNQAQIPQQDFALDSTQDFAQECIQSTNQATDKNTSKSKNTSKNASKNTDINICKTARPHIVFLTPCAKPFTQNDAKRLAKKPHIAFVCGRYEGIDERAIEVFADEVFCIGDFILTGGELAALCMCDSIARNISGVLGNSESLQGESFENYLLEAPVFARHIKGEKILDRPFTDFSTADFGFSCQAGAKNDKNFANFIAPSVYSKGNHSKISTLKNDLAVCKTRYFRPNLFEKWKIHNPNNPKKKG